MAKVKYYYDSDTLSYRKIELRKRDKFRRLMVFMVASALMGGLMVLIMYQFVESPRQKVLKRELANMQLHYELIEKKMAQAEEAHVFVRKLVAEMFNQQVADEMRIQYGGSVKPGNAAELTGQANVDGALVGGAALTPEQFLGIINAAK